MTYYHLTKREKVAHILTDGLKPQVGGNTDSVGDALAVTYMCKEEDVPYWKLILDYDALLKIQLSDSPTHRKGYGAYSEYSIDYSIPASEITEVPMPEVSISVVDILRREYLESISAVVLYWVRGIHQQYTIEDDDVTYINVTMKNYLQILRRLDYATADKERVKVWLRDYADDGEYALTDTYLNTGRRLYEVFRSTCEEYGCNDCVECINYLEQSLGDALTVDTGGWMG